MHTWRLWIAEIQQVKFHVTIGHNQSVHECFEGQGVCLDPQVASSSVPASMAERPPRVTVLLGNWSLVRGQAIRQEDETVHYNFPPSSQWPKVKPSTCTDESINERMLQCWSWILSALQIHDHNFKVLRGVTNVETSCTSDQELRQTEASYQAHPSYIQSSNPCSKGTKLPRASPSQLKSSHLAIKSIKFRGLKGWQNMVEGVRWAESGFKILNKHEETKKKSSQASAKRQKKKKNTHPKTNYCVKGQS